MSASLKSRTGIALATLPDLLPLAVAAFSLPTVLLLVLGQFHPWLVIPVGAVAAALAVWRVGPERIERPRSTVIWSALALVVALSSFLANAYLSSQDIVVVRDPSLYAATAQWLAGHSSLPIPTASDVFAGTPGLLEASPGFQVHAGGGAVDPQGSHLTQALVALVGAVFGQGALLKANAALGALALLAFFGLTRRFAGGGWALLVTVALAISMPMLHLSRAVFTEPLTLAMVVGGLSMLWRAQHSRGRWEAAAAGLILGAAALARIDGSVSLLFLVILVAFSLALAPPPERAAVGSWSAALLAGAAPPTAVGFLDLERLAPGYAVDLSPQLGRIQQGFLALVLVSLVVVLLGWRTHLLDRVLGLRWLPALAGGGVFGYALLLASRPLWLERHGTPLYYQASLGNLQKALREAVDPSRSYDENTVTWLSWYYGWPVLGLATVGLTVLTFRCVRDRDLTLVPVLTLLGLVGSLYFWQVSIVPDQIWAIRRFVPVVIPLLLLTAAYALSLLWSHLGRRQLIGRLVVGGLAIAVVVMPFRTSQPLATTRQAVPQLAQIRSVCQLLPVDAAVLLADPSAAEEYAVTLRAYCNVPTIGLAQPIPVNLALARERAAAHGRTTWVLTTAGGAVPLAPGSPTAGTATTLGKWSERLEGPPRREHRYRKTLFLGQVEPDGLVRLVPLPPVGPPEAE